MKKEIDNIEQLKEEISELKANIEVLYSLIISGSINLSIIPEYYIKQNISKIVKEDLLEEKELSLDFLDELIQYETIGYSKHIWRIISRYQKLNENFIEKYKDNIDWFYLYLYQDLSEDFLIKYKDVFENANKYTINWSSISYGYPLTINFIRVFSDKIDYNLLIKNPFINNSLKEKIKVFI